MTTEFAAHLPRLSARSADRPNVGIVHLGLGAFFRAFGAVYISEAMDDRGGDWGILGVSLRSSGTRDLLAPQDFVYTAVEKSSNGIRPSIVETVQGILVAPENPRAVLESMANPAVKIVTLTVTEKGYCHVPSSGKLNMEHPDIQYDLANRYPRSAIGFIVRALRMRQAAGHRPFTILSCDNLPANGRVVRNVVLALTQALDPTLAGWLSAEGRFPSTMIDRIVPKTTPSDIAELSSLTGYDDRAPVMHEPFRQWVIEDSFVDNLRPALENVGAQLVDDVAPFERMKLRMMNGTHSALAYLGYLAGYERISETMQDPVFTRFVRGLWEREIIPTLSSSSGEDLPAYAAALLDRYANVAIEHRTWQIAMDGSQKLPQRILGTVAENYAAGRPCPGLILAIAAWMRYVGGTDEMGRPIDVKDPLAAQLRDLSDAAGDIPGKVSRILSVREIFARPFAELVQDDVVHAYETLLEKGARAACEMWNG
jgi:fructuronate reductase